MIRQIKAFIKDLGRLGPLLTFAVIAPGLGIIALTVSSPSWLEPMKELGPQNLPIFLGATILLTGFSLIPTHAASLIAGMLYGLHMGSIYAIMAIITASLLSFFISSLLVGDQIINSLCLKPKADGIYKELLKHNTFRTIYIIILIRLSPIMPFAGTNVLLAAAKVKVSEFLIGSSIGLSPRIILLVSAGAGLSKLNSDYDKKELLVLGITATIITVIVLGKISKRVLRNMVNLPETNKEP